ncbi:Hypothetical predicted protein [Pelobates cultripes]|uniref:Uncharacterized protein n=1 Tax=Pelobates cultripes TaxID=61616 RepID=A0AAD1WEC4_PELCU|nr:Hypothetical predicted protein [Pelobates cultripes]
MVAPAQMASIFPLPRRTSQTLTGSRKAIYKCSITKTNHIMAALDGLGKRTSHVESKMENFASAHNDLATHVEQLEQKLVKLADLVDRAHRNNLRLWGIFKTILPENLQAYVSGILQAYAPEILADMLLIDRIHCLPRPRFLPDTTPRDVLVRAHYYHIKEHVLRAGTRGNLRQIFLMSSCLRIY